jgi:hypothetical protein
MIYLQNTCCCNGSNDKQKNNAVTLTVERIHTHKLSNCTNVLLSNAMVSWSTITRGHVMVLWPLMGPRMFIDCITRTCEYSTSLALGGTCQRPWSHGHVWDHACSLAVERTHANTVRVWHLVALVKGRGPMATYGTTHVHWL